MALALIGDESHNPDVYRTAFQRTLVEGAGLAIDFTDEEKLISYETLKRYKILLIFRNGTRHPGGYSNIQGDVVSVPPLEKKLIAFSSRQSPTSNAETSSAGWRMAVHFGPGITTAVSH